MCVDIKNKLNKKSLIRYITRTNILKCLTQHQFSIQSDLIKSDKIFVTYTCKIYVLTKYNYVTIVLNMV